MSIGRQFGKGAVPRIAVAKPAAPSKPAKSARDRAETVSKLKGEVVDLSKARKARGKTRLKGVSKKRSPKHETHATQSRMNDESTEPSSALLRSRLVTGNAPVSPPKSTTPPPRVEDGSIIELRAQVEALTKRVRDVEDALDQVVSFAAERQAAPAKASTSPKKSRAAYQRAWRERRKRGEA